MSESPLPPYSLGHEAQIQPPSWSLRTHSALKALRSSLVIGASGSPQRGGRFSSSQLRISWRKASVSGG